MQGGGARVHTAFHEGTIEVTETSEVPVISKEARVVEEVVVGKTATDRTETARDTVCRTDVDVGLVNAAKTTTGTTGTTGTSRQPTAPNRRRHRQQLADTPTSASAGSGVHRKVARQVVD